MHNLKRRSEQGVCPTSRIKEGVRAKIISLVGAVSGVNGVSAVSALRAIKRGGGRTHFSHSAIFATDAFGTPVGSYTVHYADGRSVWVPIATGKDLPDWLSQSQENLANAVIAWTGQNQKSRQTGQTVRLYKMVWNNPFPSVPTTRIDFIGSSLQAKPFLVAITTE